MQFFGYTITRSTEKEQTTSFAPPISSDAITLDDRYNFTKISNSVLDIEAVFKTEEELISKYRELALYTEIDAAVQDIVSEAISEDLEGNIVNLNLSNLDESVLPEALHEDMQKAFRKVQSVLNLKQNITEYFRRWYTEGRLYFHAITDGENVKKGIIEFRYIDPLNLKKISEIKKEKHPETGVELYTNTVEYFIYSPEGSNSTTAVKISKDNIVYATSGIIDGSTNLTLSYLHKAMRPANQLRMIEDANIIYFLSRAPERRVFEVEVGDIPKTQAEQYIQDIMNKHRNKVSYDSVTGEEKESRRFMSILEDYWMPMRDGKGTKITNLAGGTQLTSQLESINYFRQKLYKSLNIPISRIDAANQFNLGRATEITRDEIKFNKFIDILRRKFAKILKDALRLQCIMTGILSLEDWEKIEEEIIIEFVRDNHFFELKDLEVLDAKLDILSKAKEFEGKYFSRETLATRVLGQTEDEFVEEQKRIKLEKLNKKDKDDDSENDEFGNGFSGGSFGSSPSFSSNLEEPNISDNSDENSPEGEENSTVTFNQPEEPEEQNPETLRG